MTTPEAFVDEVISCLKELEVASGFDPSTVFEDFVAGALLTLERLPDLMSDPEDGGDKPVEIQATDRVLTRYRQECDLDPREPLGEAFYALIDSATTDYMDVLGSVYMAYGYPNQGRVFTPWEKACEMVVSTLGDREDLAMRIEAAIAQSPAARAAMIAVRALDDPDEAKAWFLSRVLPATYRYYNPIMMRDPCVGTGTMFLAAASLYPDWAIHKRLVQFHGQDIDPICVLTAKTNMLLYGLNGSRVQYALAMSEAELTRVVPDPWCGLYVDARRARDEGNEDRVEEITQVVRQARVERTEDVTPPTKILGN